MRVVIEDDDGKCVFSYAPPDSHPGELQTMCSLNDKKEAIATLAESIRVLCDSQFPIR